MAVVKLQPFRYSSAPHPRKHGPGGYDDYTSYKDWLRDEFSFRCVYCLERETWYPSRAGAFSVDHVKPQAAYPLLICDYENLVYACLRCNSPKQGFTLIDPTAVAFNDHLCVEADGIVTGLTTEGRDLIRILSLNRPPALDVRRGHLALLALKNKLPDDPDIDRFFCEAFGLPDDLPNLEAKREPTNSRPEGKKNCFWRQRAEGRLPELY